MKHKPIFLLAVIVLLSACGQSYEEKVRLSRAERARLAQEEAAALKVAVLPTLDCMPVYLAKQKNWYDSTQVDLRLKVRNAQIDCDTALKGKSVEVAVTDLKRVEHMTKHGVGLLTMGPTDSQPHGACQDGGAVGRQDGGDDPLLGNRLSHRQGPRRCQDLCTSIQGANQ